MMREGLGMVPPRTHDIRISSGEYGFLSQSALQRNLRRGYVNSSSTWRQGLIEHSTLIGMMGEMASAVFLNRRLKTNLDVDMKDRPFGDGGIDLELYGLRIQVKTRRRFSGHFLIRRVDENGSILPIRWDVCILATWQKGQPLEQVVTLDGWQYAETFLDKGTFSDAIIGTHKNLRLSDNDLLPMEDLARLLKSRKEVA